MITLTPENKINITLTAEERITSPTWDESEFTWDEAQGTWDLQTAPYALENKNNLTLIPENK